MQRTRAGAQSPRRRTWVLLLAVLAMTATACGNGSNGVAGGANKNAATPATWDGVVAAAKKEGKVTVFASQPNTDAYWVPAFEKAYPDIKLTVERVPTGDLISRIDQAAQAGAPVADVAYHANPGWFDDRGKQGIVARFPKLPAAQAWPAEAMHKYYLDALILPYGIMWNTDKGQPISSMKQFFDVVGNAGVGINDPSKAQVTAAAFQTYVDSLGGDQFWKSLSGVNAQTMDGAVAAQAVASGELTYSFPQQAGIPQDLADKGAPVKWALMDEVSGFAYATGMIANAAHPNAAKVFLNWLMQESTIDGMIKTIAQGGTSFLKVPSASVPASDVPLTNLADWPQERWDALVAKYRDAVHQ